MKSLTLFRHAKTERDSVTGRDIDRRLNERGEQDAVRMGEEIRARKLEYDRLLCSPARRAAETAELAGLSPHFDDRIYDASTGTLLAIVQEQDDDAARMMMIGHNPGFEHLASILTGGALEMPTGSLAEIELPVDRWCEVESNGAELRRFIKPKELR